MEEGGGFGKQNLHTFPLNLREGLVVRLLMLLWTLKLLRKLTPQHEINELVSWYSLFRQHARLMSKDEWVSILICYLRRLLNLIFPLKTI